MSLRIVIQYIHIAMSLPFVTSQWMSPAMSLPTVMPQWGILSNVMTHCDFFDFSCMVEIEVDNVYN